MKLRCFKPHQHLRKPPRQAGEASVRTPPRSSSLELISSDMTELWKPWVEVLQMLCHDAEHARKRTPRQLSEATWETGNDSACLTSTFISCFNYSNKLLGASSAQVA